MIRIAACTMVRDEYPSMLEWLAHHFLIGVSEFVVFDNDSIDGTDRLLDRLADYYPIQRVPWPGRGLSRQVEAFNAGLGYLAGRADFAAFIDIDEFLVVEGDGLLAEKLEKLPDDVSALAVCQMLFGSNGRDTWEHDLVTSRFTRRAVDGTASHQWIKSIVRPERIEQFTTSHSVKVKSGRYLMTDGGPMTPANQHPGEADRISHVDIRLNHYMLKSREEYRAKQRRGANSGPGRLDESYFSGRDAIANAVEDKTLMRRASEIRLKAIEMAATSDLASARRAFAAICL